MSGYIVDTESLKTVSTQDGPLHVCPPKPEVGIVRFKVSNCKEIPCPIKQQGIRIINRIVFISLQDAINKYKKSPLYTSTIYYSEIKTGSIII